MLQLIANSKEKRSAQRELERQLKQQLEAEGDLNIGHRGGNFQWPVHSNGPGKLWGAFGDAPSDSPVPRFWNGFGVFDPASSQTIVVEINIATASNHESVAGFYARDVSTGDIFLMHSGKIGGGKPGVGKSLFLEWSPAELVKAYKDEGGYREGLIVGRVNSADIAARIWRFVCDVRAFKKAVDAGEFETREHKQEAAIYERLEEYNRESSGIRKGKRSGLFEYVTYHGDVVDKLKEERNSRKAEGETVSNSKLVDLRVTKRGALTEVYEVKTSVGLQALYGAIGQLMTHSWSEGGKVAKILVIPADEDVPPIINRVLLGLGISMRRYRLSKSLGETRVVLD